ncbi:Lrp/AsnC family transcriptional regulator [bacterium SCSIO 12643]|nr:Lrp/AsnC family transcriptional regulator [bacterium SCSIO 12643]
MDAIDKQILEFLQSDAKLTAKEMAEKLSLTPTPVYERIKKLERSGIIQKYVALLDAEKANKGLTVFLNITIKEHQIEHRQKFVQEISNLKDIVELYHTSGSYDFLAKVRFSNIKEYRNFLVNEITAIKNIGDIDSQIVLEEIKYSTIVQV